MRVLHSKSLGFFFSLMVVALESLAAALPLNGAGVSYMGPMYDLLSKNYSAYDKSFAVDFRSASFDDALNKLATNTADFAVVDIPLPQKQLDQAGLLKFPMLITAIVPVVNLPGVKSDQLILNGPVLADIMAGRIESWNSPAIQALNPELKLPALPIRRVLRGAASGATLAFTSYLVRYSNHFSQSIGVGQAVKWPGEYILVRDGDSVAAAVTRTEGAIAYIEMDYAIINFLKFVSLKHKSGQVLKANLGFLRSGVVSAKTTSTAYDDPELTVIDDGQNWPILLPVYVVMRQKAEDDEKTKKLLRFFYWNFHNGDRAVEYWGLVSLPSSFQAKAIRIFRKVKSAHGDPLQIEFEYELTH